MVPYSDARRAQADVLCGELNRQIGALDARMDKLRARMAKYIAEDRQGQIARMQTEFRTTAVERRRIISMLADLGHGHPCDHGRSADR